MLNVLLLCWCLLQSSQAMLTSDLSSDYLDEINPNVDDMNPLNYPNRRVKVPTLTLTGTSARQEFARTASEQVQEPKSDYQLLNPRVISYSIEAADREERSPKRCAQLLDLCMGDVPCCNPCATCHCRFYKVYCYCRRISHSCHLGKN
ncbi:agouti-related protein [Lissotriton helveticus]